MWAMKSPHPQASQQDLRNVLRECILEAIRTNYITITRAPSAFRGQSGSTMTMTHHLRPQAIGGTSHPKGISHHLGSCGRGLKVFGWIPFGRRLGSVEKMGVGCILIWARSPSLTLTTLTLHWSTMGLWFTTQVADFVGIQKG